MAIKNNSQPNISQFSLSEHNNETQNVYLLRHVQFLVPAEQNFGGHYFRVPRVPSTVLSLGKLLKNTH